MIWAYIAVFISYYIAILVLLKGYQKVPTLILRKSAPDISFSIVVVFRNEAKNLPELLTSIQKLAYPNAMFEILFVNDGSTDTSEVVITDFLAESPISFRILQNTGVSSAPKKTGITNAIAKAQYNWIVTTDADCIVSASWLHALNDYICKNDPICVAAPVDYSINSSFIQGYQQLDNWSLQSVTVGSFGTGTLLLSNGANFTYQKSAFEAVNGFEGNLHIASGDDMFLLEKFLQRFPDKIGYLKSVNATICTKPVKQWSQLVSQRTRWAAKTTQQKSSRTKLLGFIVMLASLGIAISPFMLIQCAISTVLTLLLLLVKIVLDYLFIKQSSDFFGKKIKIGTFLLSFFLNAIITLCVFILSLFGSYTWKERNFKR